MIYRLAAPADLPALAQNRWDFRSEGYTGPFACTQAEFLQVCTEFLHDGLASGRWAYWVAEEAGELVCNMFVQIIPKVPRPGRLKDQIGYVTNVYTRPTWRNQGIAAQLLEHLKAWAIETDLELLVLWPSERSVPFYERHGFQSENEILECILRSEEE